MAPATPRRMAGAFRRGRLSKRWNPCWRSWRPRIRRAWRWRAKARWRKSPSTMPRAGANPAPLTGLRRA
eukprot:12948072-Alexandrium_andersonii.AAC.1